MQNYKLKKYVNSCFNYTGNKYKQLPQLFEYFPNSTKNFVDLFSGGGVVGINSIKYMHAKSVIINDKLEQLIDILKFFQENSYNRIYNQIIRIIKDYGLTETSAKGYKFYGADSSIGLAKINQDAFLRLRNDYNNCMYKNEFSRQIILYVLIIFGFNNEIRFNKNKKFNLPVGKRDFNRSMQNKLFSFVKLLHNNKVIFEKKDFSKVTISDDSFVYCDPPYRICTATYSQGNVWTEKNDMELMLFLDKLNKRNIPFALSNVLSHNGYRNEKLIEWGKKYNIKNIDFDYENSNYQSKAKKNKTKEVLIINY